jgi:hypothetical protein
MKHLEDIGIHIGLIMAGLFGAFLSISVQSNLTPWQKVIVVVSGSATANYLTPLILEYINLGENTRYGLAFLVGFSGLKFVEFIIVKIKSKMDKK